MGITQMLLSKTPGIKLGLQCEAEVLLSQGKTVREASRHLGIAGQTYYRWRKEYGGLNVTLAGKLKQLEKEKARLKRLVDDLSLDNAIPKEVLSK